MAQILTPFDMADHLRSEEDILSYLQILFEEGDAAEIAAALGHIARARGMSKLAEETGLSRESLYKGLSGDRVPSADTLFKVIRGLGFHLKVELGIARVL
ncbi:MAG: hypothetical protein RL497_2195 [Pseudomonadota bacterium]|jgi:probable addiction module antidote protein